jgi:hypothetical protein
MAPKSSALTAALSGAPAQEAPHPHHHHHHAGAHKSFLDPSAFPCLEYAAQVEGIVPAAQIPEEDPSALGLAQFEVVGSVPMDFSNIGGQLVGFNPRTNF